MSDASGTLERTADVLMRYSPAQPLFRWRTARCLTVLAYHDVRNADMFARHMDALRRMARPISADDVCSALGSGRCLPRSSVLLTFDDGDRSILDTALPVLEYFEFPAVAFVVAAVLDTEMPLWWQDVRALVGERHGGAAVATDPAAEIRRLKGMANVERIATIANWHRQSAATPLRVAQLQRCELATLERAGIEIGNHSFTHPCLDRCSDSTIESEIADAHDTLVDALGHSPKLFAYPNGNFDYRVPAILRRLSYEAAFLFDHRIGRFPPHDRFAISRVRVNSTTSMDRFRTIISGLHPAIHHARGLT